MRADVQNCQWGRKLMASDRGAKIPLTFKTPYALNHLSTCRTFSPSQKKKKKTNLIIK